ncbi:hypothetical protein HYQ45_010165 [Verticillium longisporum]|uniref:Glycoprotease family protein n=2 Tax=Verticillium longisporum TaxID=100787 RepID=A0A8I2ZH83_VERLO|nr:hypothetical protein HYQ44_017089 [Verticillium longisporum]KAG7131238.1 hypothetical protein HYQ45_010165 [Verticillium longisporum]
MATNSSSPRPPAYDEDGRSDGRKDNWEDWEDEEVVTPIMDDEQAPIADKAAMPSPLRPSKPTTSRVSLSRQSVHRLRRLKSRHRQRDQNAKAGIKVVTNMTELRRQNHLANSPHRPRGKFVDAAALKALEGEPSSASVGNWNWFSRKNTTKFPQSATTRSPLEQDLSPNDRPIVIGIALPSDLAQRGNGNTDAHAHMLATPLEAPTPHPHLRHPAKPQQPGNTDSPMTPSQQRSVWSPDTPDTTSPFQSPRHTSSIYSQATSYGAPIAYDAPPVPAVPSTFRRPEVAVAVVLQQKDDDDEDDGGSPCTLFEEDGNSMAVTASKTNKAKGVSKSPSSAETQTRGWWDTIVTPFTEKTSPLREAQESRFPKGSLSPDSLSKPNAEKSQFAKSIKLDDPPSSTFIPGLPASPKPSPRHDHTPIPGTYLPQEHFTAAAGSGQEVERERRRHEKEEVVARKIGGFWRGRGCMPSNGCFGRSGREGRKRRRVCLGVCCGSILLIVLVVVLCVTLIPRGKTAVEVPSIFVNLTDFPPMPTGPLTVIGPDNSAAITGCTQPTTIWSCALPKEEHDSVAPFRPNQPSFFMQIQYNNDTSAPWNIPNGSPPRPDRGRTREARGGGGIVARGRAALRKRQDGQAFNPSPAPPSFEEMYFLGNTTDGIVSDDKAGEPTPFYFSILDTVNSTVGPNVLSKRQDFNLPSDFPVELPEPELNEDGSPAPASFMPKAFQQPIRLYDRGLDTEHYGFYTYFKRSIYLRSVTVLNGTDPSRGGDGESNVPLDEDGGARLSEASFIVTWTQTRFLVQIWTRRENTTQLLSERGRFDTGSGEATDRPGTMPYPITVTMDTHGGQPLEKVVWHWKVDSRQRIDTSDPKLIANNIGFGGTLVNPRARNDTSFGGFDGGDGGCKCEWVNFLDKRGV